MLSFQSLHVRGRPSSPSHSSVPFFMPSPQRGASTQVPISSDLQSRLHVACHPAFHVFVGSYFSHDKSPNAPSHNSSSSSRPLPQWRISVHVPRDIDMQSTLHSGLPPGFQTFVESRIEQSPASPSHNSSPSSSLLPHCNSGSGVGSGFATLSTHVPRA